MMQPEEGNNKLREVDEYYRNDIELLINGAKLKRKEEPANIKTLKDEITGVPTSSRRSSRASQEMATRGSSSGCLSGLVSSSG